MLAVSVGLAVILGILTALGHISQGILPWAALGITLIAAVLGSSFCGRSSLRARLPNCILAGLGYLLLVFLARGLLFHTFQISGWKIPVLVLGGCVIGAILTSRGRTSARHMRR